MKKRVVNYGCSHAAGAEIHSKEQPHHPDNITLNFGNLVASKLNREFKIAARPGNGNKQMLHDIIEFVQPGDICLLSWTYTDRVKWVKPDNTSAYDNSNYARFHVLSVLDHNTAMSNRLRQLLPNKEDREFRHKIEKSEHYFIKNHTNSMIRSICLANYEYYSHYDIQTLEFLEIYKCANEIIKSRGATAINFHYDIEPEILQRLSGNVSMKTQYMQSRLSYYDYSAHKPGYESSIPGYESYFLTHNETFTNSELFEYYKKDTTRINWESDLPGYESLSFKLWYMHTVYDNMWGWSPDRAGHLDADAHRVLSEFIIKKLGDMPWLIT